MTAVAYNHEQLEAVFASVLQTAGPSLSVAQAGALNDIWSDIKKKALKPAVAGFVKMVRVATHGVFTLDGNIAQIKSQWKSLFDKSVWLWTLTKVGSVLVGLAAVQAHLSSKLRTGAGSKAAANTAVFALIGFLTSSLMLLKKDGERKTKLWEAWEKQVDASDKQKKFIAKFKTMPAKIDVQLAKLEAARKKQPVHASESQQMNHATAAIKLGGYSIEAVGSASALRVLANAPDFATEQVLRTSGSMVARKAFQELHNLMGDDRLTTAQKNHVADAISALKKIGPLKSEGAVAVALTAPLLGAAQMLKILTSIRDDADNDAQRRRMDNAIAVLKKNNPGLSATANTAIAGEPEEEEDYEAPDYVEIQLVDDVHRGLATRTWAVPKTKRAEAVRELNTLAKSLQTGRPPVRRLGSDLLRAGRSGKR